MEVADISGDAHYPHRGRLSKWLQEMVLATASMKEWLWLYLAIMLS
jgi:hypothetical protein